MDQMKEMKILTIDGQDYEVVDEAARKNAEENSAAISQLSEEFEEFKESGGVLFTVDAEGNAKIR